MNKTYRINLDIGSKEPQRTNIIICAGDKGITLDIGISGVDTTNVTTQIVFKKKNGEVVEAPMTKVGTRYIYTTLGNETSCPGIVVADVKLTEPNQRVSTTKFIFEVDSDTINDTPLQSGAYSTSLAEAIQACENASQHIVANNLTTTEAGYALDARQGKILNDKFAEQDWKIANNLTTTEAGYALDARMGKELNSNLEAQKQVNLNDYGSVKLNIALGTIYDSLLGNYHKTIRIRTLDTPTIHGTIKRNNPFGTFIGVSETTGALYTAFRNTSTGEWTVVTH